MMTKIKSRTPAAPTYRKDKSVKVNLPQVNPGQEILIVDKPRLHSENYIEVGY